MYSRWYYIKAKLNVANSPTSEIAGILAGFMKNSQKEEIYNVDENFAHVISFCLPCFCC